MGIIAAMEAAGIVTAAQVNSRLTARFVLMLTIGGCRRPNYKPNKHLLIVIDRNSDLLCINILIKCSYEYSNCTGTLN